LAAVAQDDLDATRHLLRIAKVQLLALAYPDSLHEVLHVAAAHPLVRELVRPHVAVEQGRRTYIRKRVVGLLLAGRLRAVASLTAADDVVDLLEGVDL